MIERAVRFAILMTATALALPAPAAAQRPPLDPAALLIRADSFALVMNGQPIGAQVVSLTREASGGFVFRETTTTSAGAQTTRVELDEDGRMRSVRQDASAPHRLLRLHVVGTPMELVRTGGVAR